MGIEILRMMNREKRFYSLMGPFLSRREIVKELGNPVWDDDGKEWFVAVDGKTVAGFAGLRSVGKHMSLVSAYVLPDHRRKGVYRKLLSARLKVAGDEPVKAVASDEAVPALKKAGLNVTGQRGRFTVLERE